MQLTQNHINTILHNLKLRQIEKALQITNGLLKSNKDDPQLNKILALIHGAKNNHHLAIEILNKLKDKFPTDFDIANNLGRSFLYEEDVSLSLENINLAIKIKPDEPTPYQNLAELYLLIRDFRNAEIAINEFLKRIEITSNNLTDYLSIIILKAHILLSLNKKDSAINILKIFLEKKLEPELCFQLLQIDRTAVTDDLVQQLKKINENNVYKSHLNKFMQLSPLLFFLAIYYEKSNPTLSEEYYHKANSEILKVQRINMISFQKKCKSIMDKYSKIKQIAVSNLNLGEENIFIVGMPRSGTSLLESVITANNQIFPAGELRAMDSLYRQVENSDTWDHAKGLRFIGEQYSSKVKLIKGHFERAVDKLPSNFQLIGFILKALPQSKIILILRDPWDVAISLYKQRYVQNVPFASSFFNIGVYMSNFEAMVKFWLNFHEIKENVYILKYENLVANFDIQQKSIYEFCQIDSFYDDQVRKNHFVRTASMNQVQNKIHKASVQKKSFESSKSEFFDAFFQQREYWADIVDFSDQKRFFGYIE